MAKNIYLDIKCEDSIEVIIRDDGVGFDISSLDSANSHFGLKIIKDRVMTLDGTFNIESSNKGVIIKINIPLST